MKVNIKETLERVIEVNSVEEVELMYKRCEVVLDSGDFKRVEFTELKE